MIRSFLPISGGNSNNDNGNNRYNRNDDGCLHCVSLLSVQSSSKVFGEYRNIAELQMPFRNGLRGERPSHIPSPFVARDIFPQQAQRRRNTRRTSRRIATMLPPYAPRSLRYPCILPRVHVHPPGFEGRWNGRRNDPLYLMNRISCCNEGSNNNRPRFLKKA